ncbi:FAD:protein FMN transferase [Oryzobacter terrae]|uniref:FAD:protein FMN transferase n=1 Tax=Oryzobacter terrae TaxID=1620385 RepID=UPI00366BCDF0
MSAAATAPATASTPPSAPPDPAAHRAGRGAWVEVVMGMPVSVHVRAVDPAREEVEAAVGRVFAHLRRVDAALSTWRSDSDLLRLQHGETGEDDVLHPWVADVAELCLEAEDRTDGLFSAWRPAWGSRGPAPGRPVFDPTGLVKGWAVAAAAEHLALVPGATWAVGAGGDVAVGSGPGPSDDPAPWRVGIEDPRDPTRVVEVVELRRGGVATSGAARRGDHVVDPRTGTGVARPGSATVVGTDLLWADVWATAAWVDPARAQRLLAERDPSYRLLLA